MARRNEVVEWETDEYFQTLKKSHCFKGNEILLDHRAKYVELDEGYIDELK